MSAFFNEPKLKQSILRRLREDQKLDRLAQGFYFEDGKGCHLGCLTRRNDGAHQATERMFNIPIRVAYWLESVFEGLPKDEAVQWVTDSIEAIPVGADLSLTHHVLCAWLLSDQSPSSKGNAHPMVAKEIAEIRKLHQLSAMGESVELADWVAARSAADSAAYSAASSAADSAADSAAYSAAYSAARSAADSVRSAAYSAADSAAYSAAYSAASSAADSVRSAAYSAADSAAYSARSAAWKIIAAKSLEIFKNCKPIECQQCDKQAGQSILFLDSLTIQ